MSAAMALLLAGSLTEPGMGSVQPPNMEAVYACLEEDLAADGSGDACRPVLTKPCRVAAADPRIDLTRCIRRLTRGWQGELRSRARAQKSMAGDIVPGRLSWSEATIIRCILSGGPDAAGTMSHYQCQMVGFARATFIADRDPERFRRGPGEPA